MFRLSLWAITLTYAGISILSSGVRASPMAGSSASVPNYNFNRNSNSSLVLSAGPNLNNPFEGITVDLEPDSFSGTRSVIQRSEQEAELNGRQVAQVVKVAVKVIEKIFDAVKAGIERDKKARGEFTNRIVAEGRRNKPQFNWIICHTKHRTQWKGVKGVDWDHDHKEFDVKYEIYYAREGEFWRDGDGGYLNGAYQWAYSGFWKADGKGNNHIVFTRPPGT
ncbi:hypothetical protein H0H81_003433 [Sphagnurus paluster]|uniref:DUF7888 domain-containing protein n=1 Tax=Sphagnurus paluster TaxID=117069 RepID=A0A9P7K5H5_9AGAR|nr:hypothetical protein H0H81_003433 [Sphagnurus paluster]